MSGMDAAEPRVELLWWSGCPSHPRALEMLRELMSEVGLDPGCLSQRQVVTRDEAEGLGFVGSPTILVDGKDIAEVDPDMPRTLSCRVYRRHDGRISPLPDRADVLAVLRLAASRRAK